ncbi:MAG TPA: TonB-dependent receptor, partial [Saprospiraceae bacterium]|nr:TonB-dependent receptor [Saprospiraceae bacterium]
EYFTQRYTGLNQDRKVFDRQKVLEGIDFFPSANLVWSPVEKQKIRLSYSRTIARPSFKEASYATISDPISGFTFIGGFFPDIDVVTKKIIWDGHLVNTDIDNFDLRWEIFGQGSDYLSVSSFYKLFKNPIEMVQYVQAPNNFQPRNVGNGMVGGAELEYIKDLSFLGNMMTGLSFRSNFMYAFSSIQMAESEYSSRIAYAREGEKIQRSRQMAGQAPYLINAVLSYKHPIHKAELTLAYNVYGRTLQYVGIADKPDIYSRPFHSLNFNANMPVLRDKKATIGVRLTNILHSTRGYVYQSFNTGDHYFSLTRPGMSISFRFSYNL